MAVRGEESASVDFSEDSDDFALDAIFQTEPSARMLSFDMWGSCRPDNYQEKLEENRIFKPLRVHLFKLLAEFLNKINVDYFIYGGTALAVYREGGKMIAHDGDIDIAILETDFSRVVNNISAFDSVEEGYVTMSAECSIYGTSWFDSNGKEIPFTGTGGKRLKFFATETLWTLFGVQPGEHFDAGVVHVDVFTIGQYPDDAEKFCVNWNIPGAYDYRAKRFPKSVFLPLKTYHFEGLAVSGPNDLKAYLEIEYGYIGRGATYDNATGLYVKIPEKLYGQLPVNVQLAMTAEDDNGK